MTREDLFAFIQVHPLAVLSSVSSEGTPQSALVGIAVTPELEIIFDTVRTSRKYANLIANPAAAFVVGCTSEQTLQYEGLARELAGEELAHYQEIYFAAWPDGRARQIWPAICYFAVKPRWLRFSDYAAGAPIEEFRFTA
jgi:hypothetical protein